MLEKRDSRSLEGVMRSALLTEKLKNALQDNKSQSMDEGLFNEKVAKLCPKGDGSAADRGGSPATEVGHLLSRLQEERNTFLRSLIISAQEHNRRGRDPECCGGGCGSL